MNRSSRTSLVRRSKKKVQELRIKDATPPLVRGSGLTKNIKPQLIRPAQDPTLPYNFTPSVSRRSGQFSPLEYNLAEIGRIEDVDGYVARSFNKKIALMFKEGWSLVGKNPKTIQYVKIRFSQIARASRKSMQELFRNIGASLIRKSNAFIVKVRDIKASGGKVRKLPGNSASIKPIAGYFVPPAETMEFSMLGNKIVKWRQVLPSGYSSKDFDPQDIIHFYYDQKEGLVAGTPNIIPVIDDVRALRKIEENIELLIYQHLFPLFQWKIGTELKPAGTTEAGEQEVDVVRREIQYMPSEGGIVTTERHEIKAVGAEGRALRAEGYLSHFKRRVFAGLGLSAIDFGEGESSNRSTAEQQSQNLIDSVKDYQQVIEIFINEFIIKELLLESTFGFDVFSEENIVKLQFQEIDLELQIKKASHYTDQFLKNVIDLDEARIGMGREPILIPTTKEIDAGKDGAEYYPQWGRLAWVLFDRPKTLIQAVDEPYCYDDKTEVLTENGWKFFKDLRETDRVGILKNNKYLTFEHPLDRQVFDYDAKMYYLKTRFLDVCVTPNHRLYVSKLNRTHYKTRHDFELIRADKVFGKYKKFKKTAIWDGREAMYYTLPEYKQKKKNKYHNNLVYKPEREIPIEDWMKFLGWYLSEGCSSSLSSKLELSQSEIKNPENCKYICALLDRMKISFGRYRNSIIFADFQIKEYLHKNAGIYSDEKHIPTDIKDYSVRLLRILLETMMAGDGETTYHYLYSTTSRQLADDVQEVALKVGWSASIRIEKRIDDRYSDIYRVAIHRDKYADVGDRLDNISGLARSNVEKWMDYKGKVYCVTTSTGVIYVRRNGKAYWCGNSDLSKARTAAEARQKRELQAKKTTKVKATTDIADGFLVSRYKNTRSEIITYIIDKNPDPVEADWIGQLIRASLSDSVEKLQASQSGAFYKGYSSFAPVGNDIFIQSIVAARGILASRINKYITSLVDDVVVAVKRNVKKTDSVQDATKTILSVFDSFEYRTRFIEDVEIRKAYIYGRAIAMKNSGVSYLKVVLNGESCDGCKNKADDIIETKYLSIAKVPPYHAACDCGLEIAVQEIKDELVESESRDTNIEDRGKTSKTGQIRTRKFNGCINRMERTLELSNPDMGKDEKKYLARAICKESVADGIIDTPTGKLERCVLKVKKSLRKRHPDWAADKIKTSAYKICNSQLRDIYE